MELHGCFFFVSAHYLQNKTDLMENGNSIKIWGNISFTNPLGQLIVAKKIYILGIQIASYQEQPRWHSNKMI